MIKIVNLPAHSTPSVEMTTCSSRAFSSAMSVIHFCDMLESETRSHVGIDKMLPRVQTTKGNTTSVVTSRASSICQFAVMVVVVMTMNVTVISLPSSSIHCHFSYVLAYL